MAVKTKRISTLIESQLPEFISTEYELFSRFVEKYYESQEVQGGPLDIISNIQKYADINFYEKNLLKQNDILEVSISDSDTTITLSDASSFPSKNGYVRIDDEIIFYATRNDTQLLDCSRGVSGNTTLGDLYSTSNFKSTVAAPHVAGKSVYNVSNLFLYAFVKNFESQYLGSFPEKYLKGEVDKRTLIKNIQKFYKSKGTDSSIKFIFNTIVAKDIDNKPSVYNPRDFTYKSSESDWISVYALKVKLVSGDPKNLIGKQIVQLPTEEYGYASATVDNVYEDGTIDDEKIWNIVLAPETVNGSFAISTKTRLEKTLSSNSNSGDRINVFSTIGWDTTGSILIGDETIEFGDKNITQFVIKKRGTVPQTHAENTSVYKPVTITGSSTTLLTLGVVYNLSPEISEPYAYTSDKIQVSEPGFQTADQKIIRTGTNQPRWFFNSGTSVSIPTNIPLQNSLNQVSTDVSAIFADDQYYYITSSSYPSYPILDGSTVDQELQDQKLLRIIRKQATRTTEVYKTPKRDVGILLNGTPIYGFRDSESIQYGALERIDVNTQGRGYNDPPFVLVDGLPNKARAILSGQVVDRIVVDTTDVFTVVPKIEITSGRGASVRAIVTNGSVTSLVIDDPGAFYSSPPIVEIRDLSGKGRFANFVSSVDTDGKITGFEKIDGGSFYTQENVVVNIIPIGSSASGTPYLKEWNFNRFEKIKNQLDNQNGYVFKNFNNVLEYGYAHVGNPKSLRVRLNDNINNADTEPTVKTHSPIIGFAYDGNPIYGPFAHQNPFDSQSPIVRMTSSYRLNGSRRTGPSLGKYPLGTFVNDYTYTHKSGSLDENNGRFCVTPDYPEGTYAYFLTIDSNQKPIFPYFIGENFYSLPVDSNYNSSINQNDIPKKSKRFFTPGMVRNGDGLIASISEVKSGTVDRVISERSSNNFSVNSKVYFDNRGTEGTDAEALVSSVKGKPVNYLESKEDKVVKLTTIQNAYLFTDDTLRQPASGASGKIVGTVQNDNVIVLREVVGTFNNTGTFSADIKTFVLLIDQDSSYTKGAILSLTDGVNPPIATGEVLEGTSGQNVVNIKVLTGTWIVDDNYFLQSSNLFNTSGSRIITLTSLSDNLEPFEVNQSVALIETNGEHGLGIGDRVDIDINPDDSTKTKNYYVRKRLYQKVKFLAPKASTTIDDTSIGRYQILNVGAGYTQGSYNNVPLTGGSGTGATASITVVGGNITSFLLQNSGSGYKEGEYLSVDDADLLRSPAFLGTDRLALYIDHIGFDRDSARLTVDNTDGFCVGDLLKVGNEIVEVSAIDGETFVVARGKEGTVKEDHFNNQPVILYKPKYNFTPGFQVSNGPGYGYISSYDSNTQEATIVYDYSTQKITARPIGITTSFFDSSSPRRSVRVDSISEIEYKFEFSEDNINFTPNPIINLQEYYRYIFDTSHSSMTGVYFDLSPSKSYNLSTLEKIESNIAPGNVGAFVDLKFGFGPRLESNNYQRKVGTNFTNFYYFDKNSIVDSEGSYFKIITDPLQGSKTVNYVTPNRFVYDLNSEPLWDGSGTISYTTTGQFAVGEVNTIQVVNLGLNYKKVPIVLGCSPNENFKATATVLFDDITNIITDVNLISAGSNFVNPKVVITDGDGVDATFNIVQSNGKIFSITVNNPGRGYTYQPTVEIVEGDVEFYVDSDTIGVPQSVSIIRNGGAYHLDDTVSSQYTSKYTVSLVNFSGDYQKGELVSQVINGTEVFRAKVSEWRSGSNLLKLEDTIGTLRENVSISGKVSKASGVVKSVYYSTFSSLITSFYDNIGYYKSDRGRLGVSNQRLIDSDFYQDYSYVIKSKTSITQWRDLIKSTTHPAGFKLFGQVDIEGSAKSEMPRSSEKASHFTTIQLWDPKRNTITVESTKRVITQSIQKLENTRIRKGTGSAATSEFNFNESRAFTFTLSAPFDGTYNTDGQLVGTKTFQLLNEQGLPFFPVSEESLIITLDGILQEPKVAYTIQGDKITFAQPPLGPGVKLTGNNSSDTTPYNGVTFYGRCFYFRDNQYNNRYLRKIRNIFQRNGRWLDAANQIERNIEFIIEESVGYGEQNYPNLQWSTKLGDYSRDIRFILEAFEHDLRFGGNAKVVDYANIFVQNTEYDYIKKNKTESLDIFNYAKRLANLAIRNWDIVQSGVSYIINSNRVTVPDSSVLAIGMYISSGRAFPQGTKITAINSPTEVVLSNVALSNSGSGPGGAAAGITYLSGTSSGNQVLPTSTGAVVPGDQYSVIPGDTVAAPTSFSGSDEATFYLSGINNGTFWDASNLIANNKEYLQEEISEYIYDTYNLPQNDKTKCRRDLGYLIDAVVYHLRFGGNAKIVEFGQLYYTNKGYPYGEQLTYINRTPEETNAAIDAWTKLGEKMILAMRNQLVAGTYTSITPYTDPSVSTDNVFPLCIEVQSSINNMISIVKDIIAEGTGIVEVVPINENKSGYWSSIPTYSNYNIIPDPLLKAQECDDVISSMNSLYDNFDDVLNLNSVTKTLPDYIDGETTEFDLFWEDGSPVITEEDEDLFITVNGVLQTPKYNESYPGPDSYYINRSVIPNKLVFDVAPIWDQDFGAKTIGEPTAVEKVVGIGVGNYKRLVIDKNLVNNKRSGPFLILDLEDLTVQNVEEPDFLLVFVDGVLQRENYSYTVSGPNIFFNVPIVEQAKIDMRYLYGRDVGQILNIYDFNLDAYQARSKLTLEITSNFNNLLEKSWFGNYSGSPVHIFQIRPDSTYNIIGETTDLFADISGNTLRIECVGSKAEILEGLDIYFAVKGRYTTEYISTSIDYQNSSIEYETDEDGRLIVSSNEQYWRGSNYRKNYKNPFLSLENGYKIRVEGEDKFRRINNLPSKLVSKEQRFQESPSRSYFGEVDIERYNGIIRGEGLSIVAKVENGVVVDLEWNQRSYDPITQPTAYQYFTPPVVNFIPEDGNGGGARAVVLVNRGQVISVDLIDGGSGYTKAPKVVVARKYEVLKENDIGVSLITAGVNPITERFNLTASSTINVIGSQVPGINTFTTISYKTPKDTSRKITAIIQLVRENNNVDVINKEFLSISRPDLDDIKVIDVFTNTNQYQSVVSGRVQDVISNTIIRANRQITSTVHNVIQNVALSNINYFEVGAFLDVQLDPTDSIVYIADTSKFKTNGYLLIGNEIVRYYRKISDRFLSVQRGQNNTTAQMWPQGTFIRQIPDPVSVAFGGVSVVESESQLVTVKGGIEVGRTERESERQIITPNTTLTSTSRVIELDVQPEIYVDSIAEVLFARETKFDAGLDIKSVSVINSESEVSAQLQVVSSEFNIRKNSLEFLRIPPPSGVVDGYQESIFISDPISTRFNGFVDLTDDYGVVKRDGSIVFVENLVFGSDLEYIGNYTKSNVGPTIGNWYATYDDGFADVSNLTIGQFTRLFSTLTIRDFVDRKDSSYTLTGDYFNLANPSIQNPVTISLSSGSIGGPLIVKNTNYFPDEGYIFTSSGTIIQYTSKTSTSFEGCTLYSGTNSISSNEELIPFTIS